MNETTLDTLVPRIAAMFADTKLAHIRYEVEDLGGLRDDAWPEWYAHYLVEQGLLDLFPPAVREQIAPRLAALLSELDARHRIEAPNEQWYDYYAAQLAALAR